MVKNISIPLTFAICLMAGCQSNFNDEVQINEFIKDNGKPVIVKKVMSQFGDTTMRLCDLTFLAPNGKILYIKNTTIQLPDTIK